MGTEDAWRSYLQKATGLAQDGIEGLESHRLSMLGFTGPTLSDQWHKFLASEGYGGKSLGDGLRAYFTAGDDGGGDDQTFDGGASVTGQPYGLLLALTQP